MGFLLGYILGGSRPGNAGGGLAAILIAVLFVFIIISFFMPAYLSIHLSALAWDGRTNPLLLIPIFVGTAWLIWPFYVMSMFGPTKSSIIGISFLVMANAIIFSTVEFTPSTPLGRSFRTSGTDSTLSLFLYLSITLVISIIVLRLVIRHSIDDKVRTAIYDRLTKRHVKAQGALSRLLSELGNSLALWITLSFAAVFFGGLFIFTSFGEIEHARNMYEMGIASGGDPNSRPLQYRLSVINQARIVITCIIFTIFIILGNLCRIIVRRRSKIVQE